MRQTDLFLLFTSPLETLGLQYMVTGSVASMVYGEPRLTNDIDIVLELPLAHVPALVDVFPPDRFYCPPEEVLILEARRTRRGHFNVIHHESGHKADVYTRGGDPLHQWGLERRRRIDLDDQDGLWLAPPEYVIVRKLEYYREGGSEKHINDVKGMLAVSEEGIDTAELGNWIVRQGLTREWAVAQASS